MPFRDTWLFIGPLLVVLGFAAGEPMVTGLGLVVLLVGGGSRLWSRHLFDRVSLRAEPGEGRVFQGEPVALTVDMENRKLLPLPWFEWRISVSDPIAVAKEHLAAAAAPGASWLVRRGALGWYQRRRWSFELRANERGYHQVGPAVIRSGDLTGLFPRELEVDDRRPLIAYPRVFSLESLGLPADRPLGEQRGRSRLFEDPLRFAGIREYRPGDSLRRIDWKATVRRGELRARVYEPSSEEQFYVLVNIDTLAHSWEGYLKDDLEHTISVAASIAVWAAGRRYAVGLLANGSFPGADRAIRLPPSRARDQLTRVLEALAVIQPLTLGDLPGAIRREMPRVPAGSTLVLVASFIPPELAATMQRLHAEGHLVAVVTTSTRADTAGLDGLPVHAVGHEIRRAEALA
ncbi:MAG: DUF58 domain-containing protein [Dehalococcoidia bacterium]